MSDSAGSINRQPVWYASFCASHESTKPSYLAARRICQKPLRGTLTDPSMVREILGLETEPELRPARLSGYKCKLWGQYPALLDAPDSVVGGAVYLSRWNSWTWGEARGIWNKNLPSWPLSHPLYWREGTCRRCRIYVQVQRGSERFERWNIWPESLVG